MKLYKKLLLTGAFIASSYAALAQEVESFARIPSAVDSGLATALGDFDNDGKIDMLAASRTTHSKKGGIYLISDAFGYPSTRQIATIPMDMETGVSLSAIDFDGDLDFIVGARPAPPKYDHAEFYRFKNVLSKSKEYRYFKNF